MNLRYQPMLCMTLLFSALLSCDKDVVPSKPAVAACQLQKEMADDGYYTLYHYDSDGNPTKIESYNPYVMTHVLEVFYDKVAVSEVNKLHPMTFSTLYDVGFMTTLPNVALVSVTMDNVTQVNWRSYFFHYDPKGRLVRVAEVTENVHNDDEWELLLSYSDADNVIKMVYKLTTGLRSLSTVIMIDGFDDQQTPFAGITSYEFLMRNWDGSDPGPIITALSKNNPTNYRLIVNEVQTMNVAMEYQYNEQGFPTVSTITNSNESGEHTYHRTYEYVCK